MTNCKYCDYPDGEPKNWYHCPIHNNKTTKESLLKNNCCPNCGGNLQMPTLEDRGESHSELITYCSCGAVYTN